MSRLKKDAIYDKMCNLLTDYEQGDGVCDVDFYEILVEIKNNWKELTS